jgi:hypothetical protein
VAVLKAPIVLSRSANAPLAVLKPPVVMLKSAPAPVAVFWFAVFARRTPAPIRVPGSKLPNQTNFAWVLVWKPLEVVYSGIA